MLSAGVLGSSMDASGPVRAVDTESALGPADEAGEILSTQPVSQLRDDKFTVFQHMRWRQASFGKVRRHEG